MRNPHNHDFGIVMRVVDGVAAAEGDAKSGGDGLARCADPRLAEQWEEVVVDLIDETVGLCRRIFRDDTQMSIRSPWAVSVIRRRRAAISASPRP